MENKLAIALFIVLLVVVLVVAFAPWQALQTSWVIPAGQTSVIHWHDCLMNEATGKTVNLTEQEVVLGFKIPNSTGSSVTIKPCEAH